MTAQTGHKVNNYEKKKKIVHVVAKTKETTQSFDSYTTRPVKLAK